jgi:Family of unknown function (DUF5947)
MSTLAASPLRRLAQGTPLGPATSATADRCELCSAPIPEEHRHLLDLTSGQPQCACRACVLLFDRGAAGGEHYRLIPQRCCRLPDSALDQRLWASLGVPVDLAFVVYNSSAAQAAAFYPSPLGVTRHTLARDAWTELRAAHPLIATVREDVEALLVRRTRGRRQVWVVAIDDCYRLVARIRAHWSGFQGGDEVWRQIDGFFEQLTEQEER